VSVSEALGSARSPTTSRRLATRRSSSPRWRGSSSTRGRSSSCATRSASAPDGKWAAFEVGVEVAAQNGKGAILEARELAGLFLLGERLIIHSAHQFDTSLEAFRRLLCLIEDTPDFDRRVQRVSRSHGEEGIELKNRQRIRFRTRTKGGGRGFSGDCLILDEAMILPESAHGALLPTLSARPNPRSGTRARPSTRTSTRRHRLRASASAASSGDDPALMPTSSGRSTLRRPRTRPIRRSRRSRGVGAGEPRPRHPHLGASTSNVSSGRWTRARSPSSASASATGRASMVAAGM
jgi:hypothetical protein